MNELFKIFLLDVAEANKIATAPDQPHKHDFEELIVGIEGELEHFIDFQSQTLEAPFVAFVTKGKVHRIIPRVKNNQCKMWVLRFQSEFIPETTFQLYSYYHDNANISMNNNACFTRFASLCEMIDGEMKRELPEYTIVKQLLNTLFTMIESERKSMQTTDDVQHHTQNVTFKNFLKILEENFRRSEGVAFYAEKLFMSSRSLNNICNDILQKSVSDIIETRKLIEAKNLLTSTDKSISEIGFELGYNEKSYFTSVFKKKSGQTPTEFREEMRKLL
jgi:AraC family transcriptional activator of pobA